MPQKATNQETQYIEDKIHYISSADEYPYHSYQFKESLSGLERDTLLFVGALRFLIAPLITSQNTIDCKTLHTLCCAEGKLGANYFVGDKVAIVRAEIGSLKKWYIPCVVNKRRMPPLSRYAKLGLIQIQNGNVYVDIERLLEYRLFHEIRQVINSLSICGTRHLSSLSVCARVSKRSILDAVVLLRLLFPNLLEIYNNGISFNDLLTKWGVGSVFPADVLWREARNFARDSIVTPNYLLMPRTTRLVRSRVARYSIPPLLSQGNFKDAIVVDIGSGFGTKGAASLRWGSKYVILLDIDDDILRARGNGLLIDKVVADAHMLPLRVRSIDVAIFWNVLNFLSHPSLAVEEIKRVVRREVIFSVYNAASGRYITFKEFIHIAVKWGIPRLIKRLGNTQFQAIVQTHENQNPP